MDCRIHCFRTICANKNHSIIPHGSTDETSLGELRSQIEDAILFGEPRIKVEDIEIDTSAAADGVLEISIRYFIPAVNTRSNMVFPFYFREGTNLRGVDSGGDTPP